MEVIIAAIIIVVVMSGGALGLNKISDNLASSNLNFILYDSIFKKYGQQYGVNPTWLKAICMNESNLGMAPSVARGLLNPSDSGGSVSSDGLSWGIMQVTVITARDFDPAATYYQLNQAEYSIQMAARVMVRSLNSFNSATSLDFEKQNIMAYNAGIGRVNQWLSGTLTNAGQNAIANASDYFNRYMRNKQVILNTQGEL